MEVAVNDLIAITGKSKEQCTLAIRAAQGNPDVAYEILASGMPLNEAMLSGAGGAGAGGLGQDATPNSTNYTGKPGNGGVGLDYSSVFGTSVGYNGWFGGGGGGTDFIFN